MEKYTIEGPFYKAGEKPMQYNKDQEDISHWDQTYIREPEDRRNKALAGGGKKRIESQHKKGKLTARERLEYLFDEGSFQEVGAFIESRFTEFGMAEKNFLVMGS